MLCVPSQSDAATGQLAAGARLSRTPAWRSAVESIALHNFSPDLLYRWMRTGAAKLDSELSHLAQLMSQLTPDREAVATSANNSAKLVGDLSSKINSHSRRLYFDASPAAENLRRCRQYFRPGRTRRGSGRDGDPVTFRRL